MRFNLKFKGRLLTIAAKEKLNISKELIDQIIEASQQDIRQSINSLQMFSVFKSTNNKFQKKDISVVIFYFEDFKVF